MESLPLDVLQRWMQDVITHPAGVVAGARPTGRSISDVITPSGRMSPDERLAIYAHAYSARLLECLQAEFPAVHHAAGDDAFCGLAAGYLEAFPSRSYTLAELGRNFSEYLHETRPPRDTDSPPDFADFLIDLARLERCYAEVFDGPGPERTPGLNAAHLAALAPGEFANSLLRFHDSVRLLELRFPCHDYATAVRQKSDAVPPPASPTRLVVFRRACVVRRMTATPAQYELLSALQRGAILRDALEHAAGFADEDIDLAADVRRWFADWTAAGLFRGLNSPTAIG